MRWLVPTALVLLACGETAATQQKPLEGKRYRAIAGASMGAMGASMIGASHPELFDAVGALGGPLDASHFLRYLERHYLGGFCSIEELERILSEHPGRPEVLDDPSKLPCMEAAPPWLEAVLPERSQRYDAWAFTQNGGTFDRDRYLDLFEDLIAAFGNPLYDAPKGSPFPPGVDPAELARPDICERPLVLPGRPHRERNPGGRYPLVTFCDGEAPIPYCEGSGREVDLCAEADPEAACAAEGGVAYASSKKNPSLYHRNVGRLRPCARPRRAVSFALAVDVNRNGRRDFGEPIFFAGAERFDDVGSDGCSNPWEDGEGGCVSDPTSSPFARGVEDPNGDDFDWRHWPGGTEANGEWDPGEPFDDLGLDGEAGTGDAGEGDGAFSEVEARLHLRSIDPRGRIRRDWTEGDRDRVAFFLDGGIRDVFHFGVHAALLFGEIAGARPLVSNLYEGTRSFPGSPETEDAFRPLSLGEGDLPRNLLYLYGNPHASTSAILAGDGDHLGTFRQAINRIALFLRWLSFRWSDLEDPPADRSSFPSRARSLRFTSPSLGGAERSFAVVLPPGYDDPSNAQVRYPVVYLLHGYGGKASGPGGFWENFLLYDGWMATGEIRKMILVFPSGRCCLEKPATGEKICTEDGATTGFVRTCNAGSFYAASPGSGRDYAGSILELIDHVDRTYRTLSPSGIPPG